MFYESNVHRESKSQLFISCMLCYEMNMHGKLKCGKEKPFLLFICNTKRSSNIFFSYLSSIFLQRKKANFIMKENKTSLSNIVITGKECDK